MTVNSKLIVTATFTEAEVFIDTYHLKLLHHHRFKIYRHEHIILIISGIGILPCAIATSYAIALFKDEIHHVYNIGIAGCIDENIAIATPLLINKLYDPYQDCFLYPDIILSHPFKESDLSSYAKPVYKSQQATITTTIVDMEGVGFFTTSAYYIPLHNISLIKIVSDHLINDNTTISSINKSFVRHIMQDNIAQITDFINSYYIEKKQLFSCDEQLLISQALEHIKVSISKKAQIKNYIKYHKIKNNITILSSTDISTVLSKITV